MWAENPSNLLSRSPLRFDRMLNQTQHSFWKGASDNRPLTCGAALPIAEGGANNERRAPARRRSAHWRRELLIEDMTDLLGRALIYALATLGLLNAFGLVAAA